MQLSNGSQLTFTMNGRKGKSTVIEKALANCKGRAGVCVNENSMQEETRLHMYYIHTYIIPFDWNTLVISSIYVLVQVSDYQVGNP